MNTPKPSRRELERESRRLERRRQLELAERRVVDLRPADDPRADPQFAAAPDPKDAA